MSRWKLKLEEGWTSFLLVLLMVLTVAWSVLAADWTEGLAILPWIVVMGATTGLLLAKLQRIPSVLAHLLSMTIGAAVVAATVNLILSPPVVPAGLMASAQGLLSRSQLISQLATGWLGDPTGAEPWLSNLMFVLSLACLCWLLAYVCSWFIFRLHSVWGAV